MSNSLPIRKDVELFRWGPIPGNLFCMSDYHDIHLGLYPKKYPNYRWPDYIMFFEGNLMYWLNEMKPLEEAGRKLFFDIMIPKAQRKLLRKRCDKTFADLVALEEKIDKTNLKGLSSGEFLNLWNLFRNATQNFWSEWIPCEMVNYGCVPALHEYLKKYIKNENELASAMEIFTAPESPSFYQQEEIELSKTNNIAAHQKKYFWIENSYGGAEVLDKKYFIEKKKELPKNIRQKIEKKFKEIKKKKIDTLKRYKIPEDFMKLADAAVISVMWQDERKGYVFKFLHYKDILLKEASRRLKVNAQDLMHFKGSEIAKMLSGEDFSQEMERRRNPFAMVVTDKVLFFYGQDALKLKEVYEHKNLGTTENLKGTVVSKGKGGIVKGKVRIVFDPKNAGKFNEGDILVSGMTSPDYVFLMKKAGAIITDSGGITSHAAVASRELEKLCIVNTKIATKILHDDDVVEIDSNKGVVKILK
ncbi:MAG: PEP-utilizing enzyme [Candidatus Staskawiczbacteria bacterium]|jgi:phosphohistidine swiveling domain-containing protein